jgi:hypothetical protein
MSDPLFPLGQVVMTPGAAAAFEASGDDPLAFLIKHVCLDPGDLDVHDIRENQLSVDRASESCPLTASPTRPASGSSRKPTAA